MKIIHALFADESGCVYCKKINGIIKLVPFKSPCLRCEKCVGTNQGEGCECRWDDFDFDYDVVVFDPIAEYDRINDFRTVPKKERLRVWEEKNMAAKGTYKQIF